MARASRKQYQPFWLAESGIEIDYHLHRDTIIRRDVPLVLNRVTKVIVAAEPTAPEVNAVIPPQGVRRIRPRIPMRFAFVPTYADDSTVEVDAIIPPQGVSRKPITPWRIAPYSGRYAQDEIAEQDFIFPLPRIKRQYVCCQPRRFAPFYLGEDTPIEIDAIIPPKRVNRGDRPTRRKVARQFNHQGYFDVTFTGITPSAEGQGTQRKITEDLPKRF